MLHSPAAAATRKGGFAIPGAMLALAALVLVALTFAEWRAMAHPVSYTHLRAHET